MSLILVRHLQILPINTVIVVQCPRDSKLKPDKLLREHYLLEVLARTRSAV